MTRVPDQQQPLCRPSAACAEPYAPPPEFFEGELFERVFPSASALLKEGHDTHGQPAGCNPVRTRARLVRRTGQRCACSWPPGHRAGEVRWEFLSGSPRLVERPRAEVLSRAATMSKCAAAIRCPGCTLCAVVRAFACFAPACMACRAATRSGCMACRAATPSARLTSQSCCAGAAHSTGKNFRSASRPTALSSCSHRCSDEYVCMMVVRLRRARKATLSESELTHGSDVGRSTVRRSFMSRTRC